VTTDGQRESFAVIISALAVAPRRDVSDGTRVIELSAEPEEIIGRLIDVGQDATRDEVVKAAFETCVARDGWPVPRRRWAIAITSSSSRLERAV
jgi:hypothetical protein